MGDPEAGGIGGVRSERRGQRFAKIEGAPVPHLAVEVTGKKELGRGWEREHRPIPRNSH